MVQVDWSECQYNSGLTNCEHHCDKEADMVSSSVMIDICNNGSVDTGVR